MSWTNEFTLAVIKHDVPEMDRLMSAMPQFSDIKEALLAQGLIKEAIAIVKEEREQTYENMQKLKKARAFVTSAAIISAHNKEYRG